MSSASKVATAVSSADIKQAFQDHLRSGLGRLERFATKNDLYLALALTVRNRLFERTVETMETYGGVNARRVAYLSAEYLPAASGEQSAESRDH
jgi:starch phosphorylase